MLLFLSLVSSIEKEETEEHGNSVKVEIASTTPVLEAFRDFFQASLLTELFSSLVAVESESFREIWRASVWD